MNTNKTWLKHIDFILIDIISIVLSYVLAFLIYINDTSYLNNSIYIGVPALLALCVFIFGFNEYSDVLKRPNRDDLILNVKISFKTIMLVLFVLWTFKISGKFSRVLLLLTTILYFFIATIVKRLWKYHLISRNIGIKKTIKISKKKNNDTNFVYNSNFNWKNVLTSIGKGNIDEIVILDGIVVPGEISNILIENGVKIVIEIENKYPFNIKDNWYINSINNKECVIYSVFEFSNKQYIHLFLKRLFDIVFGILGCVINIPLAIMVKISYILNNDFNSIFYIQKRIGKNGKEFKLYKYRTMIPNAEVVLKEMLKDKKNKEEWNKKHKFDDDPRITKMGKLLRKTSLDEFPQFINILIGNMSLVGPRPLVEGELESHTDSKLYWRVKPGLTGWWGCNGRSNLDYKERLELEYYYIRNYSLELDLICILKTIKAVLIEDGAK